MFNFIKKRSYLFLSILLIIFIFLNLKNNFLGQKNKTNSYQIKKEDIKEVLVLSGQVDVEEKATLRFQTPGRLAWVGVKEGDFVKKYQLIASLDQRDLENRLKRYLNSYVKQRLSFEQTKDDYWQKQFDLSDVVRKKSERILEQNQYDLENAVLDVEYQKMIIENSSVWSPIDGVVVRVDAPFPGLNVMPTQAEFEIVNPKTLYFSATADQTEVVNLKQGQKGKIIFDSFPNQEFDGEIYWIAFTPKKGDSGTVYQIKVKFDSRGYNFKLGMSGDIEFLIKEKKGVLTIPQSYLKKDKKGDYVNLVNGGKVKKIYIKKGEEIEGKVIINKGLKEGDLILN